MAHDPFIGRPLEVAVDERGVTRAIKKLRRRAQDEGVFREIKRRRFYEKPSEAKKRKQKEAARRRRRRARRLEQTIP